MSMTDPIADMLTRIRNANMAGHERFEIILQLKLEIARILSEQVSYETTVLLKMENKAL